MLIRDACHGITQELLEPNPSCYCCFFSSPPPSPFIVCISHAYRMHIVFTRHPQLLSLRLWANWNFKWTNSLCLRRRSFYMGHYVVSSAFAYISDFGAFLSSWFAISWRLYISHVDSSGDLCMQREPIGNELIKVQQIVEEGSEREGCCSWISNVFKFKYNISFRAENT